MKILCRNFFVWFLLALPVSPSIYALFLKGPACFAENASAPPIECVAPSAALAPIAAILGPIPYNQSKPPSVLPEILATALVVAFLLTALGDIIRRTTGPKDLVE